MNRTLIPFCWFSENGLSMFLWIGHSVEPHWVQQVFGVQSAAQIDIDKVGHCHLFKGNLLLEMVNISDDDQTSCFSFSVS